MGKYNIVNTYEKLKEPNNYFNTNIKQRYIDISKDKEKELKDTIEGLDLWVSFDLYDSKQRPTSYLQKVNVMNYGGAKMSLFYDDGKSHNLYKNKVKNKVFYKKINGDLIKIDIPVK